jgi:hypothetical protein
MYLQAVNDEFYSFFITPIRELTEKDLTPAPYYRPYGNYGQEAKYYTYNMYQLEKVSRFYTESEEKGF